jgi:hypothetical protein
LVSFLCHFLSYAISLSGQAWPEDKGPATSCVQEDYGQETDSAYIAMIYIGRMRLMTKKIKIKKRCSQAILDFLATTDVGRRITDPAEEEARSEMSEWELPEQEKGEERN